MGELNRSVSRAVSTAAAYGSTNSAFCFKYFSAFFVDHLFRENTFADSCFDFSHGGFHVFRNNKISFPAANASTSASPGVLPLVTPFMFMASVKQRPLKCNFSRSRFRDDLFG